LISFISRVTCWCSGRRLSGAGRQPIRVTLDTARLATVSPAIRSVLEGTVLPAAQTRLTALLKVDPVAGNLQARRRCISQCVRRLGRGREAFGCAACETADDV
jgi:hypothetical protein